MPGPTSDILNQRVAEKQRYNGTITIPAAREFLTTANGIFNDGGDEHGITHTVMWFNGATDGATNGNAHPRPARHCTHRFSPRVVESIADIVQRSPLISPDYATLLVLDQVGTNWASNTGVYRFRGSLVHREFSPYMVKEWAEDGSEYLEFDEDTYVDEHYTALMTSHRGECVPNVVSAYVSKRAEQGRIFPEILISEEPRVTSPLTLLNLADASTRDYLLARGCI
jgi:hypothetical protein